MNIVSFTILESKERRSSSKTVPWKPAVAKKYCTTPTSSYRETAPLVLSDLGKQKLRCKMEGFETRIEQPYGAISLDRETKGA
jgi:hypothetical protein